MLVSSLQVYPFASPESSHVMQAQKLQASDTMLYNGNDGSRAFVCVHDHVESAMS